MNVQARHVAHLLHRDIYDVIPLFLCPALWPPPIYTPPRRYIRNARPLSTSTRRRLDAIASPTANNRLGEAVPSTPTISIPVCCPGCGAPSQSVLPKEPGFYSPTRKGMVKKHLKSKEAEEEILNAAMQKIGKGQAEKWGLEGMKGICTSTLGHVVH